MPEEPKQPEPDYKKAAEAATKYIVAMFHILLQHAGGGMEVPLEVLQNYPDNPPMKTEYDGVNKAVRVFIPKKRKRGVIVPSRKLIIPNPN